jgi:uncharacterized protein YaiI (UPF0178 family)
MLDIYIDADACPVKEEVYRVAERYQLKVFLVANKWMSMPASPRHEVVVASAGFDGVDDWIVEHIQAGDIVITADILPRIVTQKSNSILRRSRSEISQGSCRLSRAGFKEARSKCSVKWRGAQDEFRRRV